jgi:catechol 2,3-dioxygenase-like lactoylglutathione lyase family enzyme
MVEDVARRMMQGLSRVVLLGLALGAAGCKGDKQTSPLLEMARACAHDGELSCARPIFTVRDLRASLAYYRDALGFKVDWEYGEPPGFGSVSRGHGGLFMCQDCQGHPGAWAMMFTPDVDRLHAELVRRKAIIRMPPTDMPWRMREMHVADPDGNILRFGSGLDDD